VSARARLWTGRFLTGFVVLFLLFDATIKLLRLPIAVEGTTQLGYPADAVLMIGIIELLCVVLYLAPQTAVLGAVLLTGYLGGAIATHVRVASPLLTHVLFPIYVAAMIWGGLLLRDPRWRVLLPFRGAGLTVVEANLQVGPSVSRRARPT
jgi:hypothetical protein